MSATLKAAVRLGQDYEENLRSNKNTDFEQVKALFDISQSLILNHTSEIFGISSIEWKTTPWTVVDKNKLDGSWFLRTVKN